MALKEYEGEFDSLWVSQFLSPNSSYLILQDVTENVKISIFSF